MKQLTGSEKQRIFQEMKEELIYGEDINELLVNAVFLNIPNAVLYFLKRGADPNTMIREKPPLICAFSYSTDAQIIEKYDVRFGQGTSIQHMKIINLLLEYGADIDLPDQEGKTALIHASEHGLFKIVKLLLENGADVHLSDQDGNTALHEVLQDEDQWNVAILLMEYGADPCAKNYDEIRPIDLDKRIKTFLK